VTLVIAKDSLVALESRICISWKSIINFGYINLIILKSAYAFDNVGQNFSIVNYTFNTNLVLL
jgi:hypothetical protein